MSVIIVVLTFVMISDFDAHAPHVIDDNSNINDILATKTYQIDSM